MPRKLMIMHAKYIVRLGQSAMNKRLLINTNFTIVFTVFVPVGWVLTSQMIVTRKRQLNGSSLLAKTTSDARNEDSTFQQESIETFCTFPDDEIHMKLPLGENRTAKSSETIAAIVVHISPESRVKADSAESHHRMTLGQWHEFPILIENAAGITTDFNIHSKQEMVHSLPSKQRWLQYKIDPPGKLSGEPREWRMLRCKTDEFGVRAAILEFDAGQGTQDLGFRSDLILVFEIERNE